MIFLSIVLSDVMADSISGNLASQLSATMTAAISMQVNALVPEILQSLRSDATTLPNVDSGLSSNHGVPIIVSPPVVSEIPVTDLDHQKTAELHTLSFKTVLMQKTLESDDFPSMQAQRKGEYLSIKVDERLVQNDIS